jgi:hypothetical protein
MATAQVPNGRVLIAGGQTGSGYLRRTLAFDASRSQ